MRQNMWIVLQALYSKVMVIFAVCLGLPCFFMNSQCTKKLQHLRQHHIKSYFVIYCCLFCANLGPFITNQDKAVKPIRVLSSDTIDLEIVHHMFIQFPREVWHNSASFSLVLVFYKEMPTRMKF